MTPSKSMWATIAVIGFTVTVFIAWYFFSTPKIPDEVSVGANK